MQFYVADYLADTMHLTTEEHGAYLLLIMNYWQTGKALHSSSERLANVAKMQVDRFNTIKNTLKEFFDEADDRWIHKRIESDLKAVKDKSNKARKAAKSRFSKPPDKLSERTANAQRTQCHTDTDTDTNTNLKKLNKKSFPQFEEFSEGIQIFLNTYHEFAPQRVGDITKLEIFWAQENLDEVLEGVLAGLARWQTSKSWSNKKFVCMALKFLQTEKWRQVPNDF
jgi:uncharacterized protein YdaU (DUF1376 family)